MKKIIFNPVAKFFLMVLFLIIFLFFIFYLTILYREKKYFDYNLNNNLTITYEEYLYADKKPWHTLTVDNKGNVIFRGKTVLKKENVPLNEETAYTTLEMLILFNAKNIKPRKGCNLKDKIRNGSMGCYMLVH